MCVYVCQPASIEPQRQEVDSVLGLHTVEAERLAVKAFSGLAFDPRPDSQQTADWYHASQTDQSKMDAKSFLKLGSKKNNFCATQHVLQTLLRSVFDRWIINEYIINNNKGI